MDTPQVLEERSIGSGVWIGLSELTYRDSQGAIRKWECVRRQRTTGAASVICEVQHHGEPHLVAVKQFRPPANAVVLELPAGLLDPDEQGATAAARELHEETGWRGKIVSSGPFVFNSPGLASERTMLVRMNAQENTGARPDHDETIEVVLLPLRRLKASLLQHEREGSLLDAKLWSLAEGIELGLQLSKPLDRAPF